MVEIEEIRKSEKVITQLGFNLVPADAKIKVIADYTLVSSETNWSASQMKEFLKSVRDLRDSGEEYEYVFGGERVVFVPHEAEEREEIELFDIEGNTLRVPGKEDRCPGIGIRFSNKFPSVKFLEKTVEIIKRLKEGKRLDFKIYSAGEFMSVEDLERMVETWRKNNE